MMNYEEEELNPANTITLSQVLSHYTKILGDKDFAKSFIKGALSDGRLTVRAETIIEEYASGNIRPLDKVLDQLVKHRSDKRDGFSLLVEARYLRQEPKGAQLVGNWPKSHLAWIAPQPHRFSIGKISGKPRAILPIRIVMYDVTLDRSEVETTISRIIINHKIGASVKSRPPRAYRSTEKYRELMPEIFEYAESGELGARYSLYHIRGSITKFHEVILKRLGTTISPSTAKRIATKLIEIDEKVLSERKQQQLTNN